MLHIHERYRIKSLNSRSYIIYRPCNGNIERCTTGMRVNKTTTITGPNAHTQRQTCIHLTHIIYICNYQHASSILILTPCICTFVTGSMHITKHTYSYKATGMLTHIARSEEMAIDTHGCLLHQPPGSPD